MLHCLYLTTRGTGVERGIDKQGESDWPQAQYTVPHLTVFSATVGVGFTAFTVIVLHFCSITISKPPLEFYVYLSFPLCKSFSIAKKINPLTGV